MQTKILNIIIYKLFFHYNLYYYNYIILSYNYDTNPSFLFDTDVMKCPFLKYFVVLLESMFF